jgi:hypothetical protein
MAELDPMTVAFITGPFVPIIVGLLVKYGAPERLKVIVNAIVAQAVAFVANAVIPETGTAVLSWEGLSNFLITALFSATAYTSFWKPVFNLNERLMPNVGIGSTSSSSP